MHTAPMSGKDLRLDLIAVEEAPPAEQTALVPSRIGRDEMNLAEFPFALLSNRAPAGMSTIQFEDSIEGKDGETIRRTWTITGADAFGLPLATDEEVYVALMELTKDQGFASRTVSFTRYDLIRRLGWQDSSHSYRRLRSALDRLLGVTIKAEKAFWDNSKQAYVDVGFHMLDDYALYDETPGRKRQTRRSRGGSAKGAREEQEALPLSFFTWHQVIFRSFQAGNIKQLDTVFFFSLNSNVSRRLYRYLDKKRYDGKNTFRIGLRKLAFEKLGMSRNYYPSHIKQELERAHEELVLAGFLEKVEYRAPSRSQAGAGRSAEEQVVYHFRVLRPALSMSQVLEMSARELLDALVEVGITEATARGLIAESGPEAIVQLQYLPYRGARDPAAVLVEAIRGAWEPPASYLRAQAEEERRERERQERLAQRQREAREEARASLDRAAMASVLEDLEGPVRQELVAEAKGRVAARSAALAAHPETQAYLAMFQEELLALVRGRHAEAFERCRRRVQRSLGL